MNCIHFFQKKRRDFLHFDTVVSAFASGFMTASLDAVLYGEWSGISFTDIAFVNNVSLSRFFFVFLAFTALLFILALKKNSPFPIYAGLFAAAVFLSLAFVNIVSAKSYQDSFHGDIVFLLGIAMVNIVVVKHLFHEDKLNLISLSRHPFFTSWKNMYILTAVCIGIFIIVVSLFTCCRYLTYSSSTFDFGIFTQMFENMKHTGLPVTTVERGKELSHFAVHFSPSWYLLLPGYLLFPSPFYLYIANAAIIGIGAFPVFRICKHLGTSPIWAFAFAIIYLLFPTMAAGALWDIHENSLLPVLILYMAYFFLSGKTVPMLLFSLLTLGDKEDAAIYVAAFALYGIFGTKYKWKGVLLLFLSVIYFFFATAMIQILGGEVMTSRLNLYFPEGNAGFAGVVKTCFTDIGYLLRNVFALNDNAALFSEGKLQFILWMLVPVLFAPFLSRKNSLLFLLIPMLVINLMPAWKYQYDVYYQYTYGPAALIILSALLAFHEMEREKKRLFTCICLLLCFLFSNALFWAKGGGYISRYFRNRQIYDDSQQTLTYFLEELYTEGDSVSANFVLVPHLYEITNLYTIPEQYGTQQVTDWYILNTQYTDEKYNPSDILQYYKCINPDEQGFVRIYQKQTQ